MATNSENTPARRLDNLHPDAAIDWSKPGAPAVPQSSTAGAVCQGDITSKFSEIDIPADAPHAFAKRYSALLEENRRLKEQVAASIPPLTAPAPLISWQPIETAPKDGSEVLLFLGAPWNRVALARWFDAWENWQECEFPDIERDEYGGIGCEVPSHWAPLPAAPGAAPAPQQSERIEPPPLPKNEIAAKLAEAATNPHYSREEYARWMQEGSDAVHSLTVWARKAYGLLRAKAAPAAPVQTAELTPLDYRAQGREEALATILAESPEEPFSDYTHSYPIADTGDYGTEWDEPALRELLSISDREHDAYDRAEAAYWESLGHKEEAERMKRMVERAPHFKPLLDYLSEKQEWGLLHLLQEAEVAAPVQAEQAQAEPVAWMNPETLDVIHDTRKRAWENDFGMGGKAKAAGYTYRLVAPAQAEQAAAVPDIVREAVEAAFEDRKGWRTKIAAAVRALATKEAAAVEAPSDLAKKAERYEFLRHADLDALAAAHWPGGEVPEGRAFGAAIDAFMAAQQIAQGDTGGDE